MREKLKTLLQAMIAHFVLCLGKALVFFPFRWQIKLGRLLGSFAFYHKKIRKIILINLSHCFPHLSNIENKKFCKDICKSLGMGVIEALNAWYMSDRRFKKINFVVHGQEILEKCQHNGVFILSGHFHSSELIARHFLKANNIYTLYRPCKQRVFDRAILKQRQKNFSCIAQRNLKSAIKVLKNFKRVVFLPDINRSKHSGSSIVSFFGVPCYTTNSISKIPVMTGAKVLFVSMFRDFEKNEYHYFIREVLGKVTPKLFNQLLEEAVCQHPEQYLWTQKRFGFHSKVTEKNQFYADAY